jgi:hypothetical protein
MASQQGPSILGVGPRKPCKKVIKRRFWGGLPEVTRKMIFCGIHEFFEFFKLKRY